MGTWESTETPKTSKCNCRGQNTLRSDVLYIIGKLSKHKCRKWARMSHLDICSTSYGKKKGQESNWQFDSRPPKVGNRPDPDACRWSATQCWKALDERYKFALDLIPIGGLSKELWPCKVAGIQIETVSRLLGSPEMKSYLNVGVAERRREYYMGEGGDFLRVRAMVSLVSPESPVACPSIKGVPESELTNLLVGWMQIRVSNQRLVILLSPISELQHAPSTPFSVASSGAHSGLLTFPLFDQLIFILSLTMSSGLRQNCRRFSSFITFITFIELKIIKARKKIEGKFGIYLRKIVTKFT
jgi:hypothetical protein